MNYSDFKDLDEFKVYLKKLAVEDIGKVLDELEKVVKINSYYFDYCMICRVKYRRFLDKSKSKEFDEEFQVQEYRIIRMVFGLINDLKIRFVNEKLAKKFFPYEEISLFENRKGTIRKFANLSEIYFLLETLLYRKKVDKTLDFLNKSLKRKHHNEIIIFKARRKNLERSDYLGSASSKDIRKERSKFVVDFLSYIRKLKKKHFKKKLFKTNNTK